MKVLFIGAGLTDYIVQLLNRLHSLPGLQIYNLVDSDGVGHVPAGAHQTREGVTFNVVELDGTVAGKYSDRSYWSFRGLADTLHKVRPDVVVVSEKYIKAFLYDRDVVAAVKALHIRLILRDNPFRLERYNKVKADIDAGRKDAEYTPFYVLYFVRIFERLGSKNSEWIKTATLSVLKTTGFYTKARIRRMLLARLEEKKLILNFVDANASYIEQAYDLYGSYGVPREKIFVLDNSPDTDLLFAVREKVEQEPPLLPTNRHRFLHVGRLIPWKRVDLLLRSLKDLRREFTNAELIIIGYGPQEEELKALAKELGVEDAAKFVGGVYDPALLGKYFLSSAVYVLAGMGGLSINDAMTFGSPIICSVCDGTEKKLVYEGRNGLYFKAGDGEDLTDKIRTMLKDPVRARQMGERSTEIIKTEVNIHTLMGAYQRAFAYVLGTR